MHVGGVGDRRRSRYASEMSGDRPNRYQYSLRDLFLVTLAVAAVCALLSRVLHADAGLAVLLVITVSFSAGALLKVTVARFGSKHVNKGQRRHGLRGNLLWGVLSAGVVTLLLLISVLLGR